MWRIEHTDAAEPALVLQLIYSGTWASSCAISGHHRLPSLALCFCSCTDEVMKTPPAPAPTPQPPPPRPFHATIQQRGEAIDSTSSAYRPCNANPEIEMEDVWLVSGGAGNITTLLSWMNFLKS
mmetsp:Transcript_27661/g.71009  ORF Transcript_27661/g.71009 Transcript_27661/m.71009 type:complete len:124 (-) Transcript_27661:495-866(-)